MTFIPNPNSIKLYSPDGLKYSTREIINQFTVTGVSAVTKKTFSIAANEQYMVKLVATGIDTASSRYFHTERRISFQRYGLAAPTLGTEISSDAENFPSNPTITWVVVGNTVELRFNANNVGNTVKWMVELIIYKQ